MKVNLPKNFNPMSQTFLLNRDEIEAQAIEDLIKYKKIYYERYRKPASTLLDVDNFVKELWGIVVEFGPIDQQDEENEILGRLEPDKKRILIDDSLSTNSRRISFTLAHEAGHLSLHGSMFSLVNGLIVGWSAQAINCSDPRNAREQEIDQIRKEWQANKYASALLATKIEIINLLKEIGLIQDNSLIAPLDLSIHFDTFQNRFGLSRQALEIRLSELGITCTNKKYDTSANRKAA